MPCYRKSQDILKVLTIYLSAFLLRNFKHYCDFILSQTYFSSSLSISVTDTTTHPTTEARNANILVSCFSLTPSPQTSASPVRCVPKTYPKSTISPPPQSLSPSAKTLSFPLSLYESLPALLLPLNHPLQEASVNILNITIFLHIKQTTTITNRTL